MPGQKDREKHGGTDRPYFIGLLRVLRVVQKGEKQPGSCSCSEVSKIQFFLVSIVNDTLKTLDDFTNKQQKCIK